MRILVISNLFPPNVLGGYEILCEQVCSRLQELGHEIKVLTAVADESDQQRSSHVERSLQLYLPFSQPARFARWRRWSTSRHNYRTTAKAIREYQLDIIFIWSQLRLTTGCARAAEDSGIPVAYTMNDEHVAGYVTHGTGVQAALRRLLDQHLLKIGIAGLRFTKTTCISQTVKDRLCAQGVPISSAEVIFQGIPIEKFPSKAEPGKINHPARILYVGQLHSYKGVHNVIGAVSRLHWEGVHVQLTICGRGTPEYEEELGRHAKASPARITFLGQVPHDALGEIYRDHDIFVFPSTWAEPFGLTHLEAMASGTPVVSTAEGGHGEFLRHQINASIFPPKDEKQLAERLFILLNDQDYAMRLANTALEEVRREFSLEAYVARLEQWLNAQCDDVGKHAKARQANSPLSEETSPVLR
jgi:glycogen synthase